MTRRILQHTAAALIFVIAALATTGCDSELAAGFPTVFVQNVLIEEITGTWCGYCPDGASRLKALEEQHPGRVFGAAIHTSDLLQIVAKTAISDYLGGYAGVPAGAVNRQGAHGEILGSRAYWQSLTETALAKTPICAIQIDSEISGATLTAVVSTGFRSAPSAEVALTVYVVEDGVTGYPQANYYDDTSSSDFYQLGNPIVDYVHVQVLREVLSDPEGDSLADGAIDKGVLYGKTYTYQVPADQVASNLSVIAFVHGTGMEEGGREILNVQQGLADGGS